MIRTILAAMSLLLFLATAADAQARPPIPTSPETATPFLTFEFPAPLKKVEAEWAKHPLRKERFELGRRLFFDPRLSGDGTISCASCHKPEKGFADDRALSLGIADQKTEVNTPSLINRYLGTSFMWDGRFETLEDQALDPIENPKEMGSSVKAVLAKLSSDTKYGREFERAWPKKALSRETLAGSLAHFIRHIRSADSPVDRFRAGTATALNDREKRGLWLYESRGRCWQCHGGNNFSDELFHNTGVGAKEGRPREGRFAVTKEKEDRGRFKTPTLRGVAHTAPYMHDGSFKTLQEVVEFYRDGGIANRQLDKKIKPIELSDEDVFSIVAFLEALSRAGNDQPKGR